MPRADGRVILALVGIITITVAAFGIWPELDLSATALFYTPGSGFALTGNSVTEALRLAVWDASLVMVGVALGVGIFAWVRSRQSVLGVASRAWGGMLLLYLLGPGLLIDGLLKRTWGRARPANVVEFGGTARFTPPHQMSGECLHNCSLASGEVAGATALAICLMLILWCVRPRMPVWLHRVCVAAAAALPILTGLQRLAAGRHFLSDVLLAILLTALIAALLSRFLPLKADGHARRASRLVVEPAGIPGPRNADTGGP